MEGFQNESSSGVHAYNTPENIAGHVEGFHCLQVLNEGFIVFIDIIVIIPLKPNSLRWDDRGAPDLIVNDPCPVVVRGRNIVSVGIIQIYTGFRLGCTVQVGAIPELLQMDPIIEEKKDGVFFIVCGHYVQVADSRGKAAAEIELEGDSAEAVVVEAYDPRKVDHFLYFAKVAFIQLVPEILPDVCRRGMPRQL